MQPIKKVILKDGKKQLILYEAEIYVDDSDGRPNFIIGNFERRGSWENIIKSQDLILQINGLGDKENEDIVNLFKGQRIKLIIKLIEDEEENE